MVPAGLGGTDRMLSDTDTIPISGSLLTIDRGKVGGEWGDFWSLS